MTTLILNNKSEVSLEEPSIRPGFRLFSRPMFNFPLPTRAIGAGLVVTVLQLAIAVLLLAPQGPLQYRYQSLVQHDSYWFANIVNRGYQTIVPPIAHKMMEVSNTAFFPGYPLFAAALRYGFGFSTENALLLAAQSAAWGFWTYFFLFCQRWCVPAAGQFFGSLAIAAHPAAFFLIAAYSESLFLMALLGFLYWSSSETRRGNVVALLHGMLLSATRIVGLPCALAPLVRKLWQNGGTTIRNAREWMPIYGATALVSLSAMLGGLVFFLYCQLRWGRWDLYMLTQQFGWGIEPDYLAVFKPSSYRWLLPPLDDPTRASQMAMTLGGLLLLIVIACEFLPIARRGIDRATRVGIYFAAIVLYFVSVSGVACVAMESMLRYEFCVHAVIVLALMHYFVNVSARSRLVRAGGLTTIVLLSAAGLGLQSWYVWNFTRGNWVA